MIATLYANLVVKMKDISGGLALSPSPVDAVHGEHTEIPGQEEHAPKVDNCCARLTQDHVAVPRCDLERDHDEFVDNKSGVGYGDNVQEFRVEEK
jgi:hypothetical protein